MHYLSYNCLYLYMVFSAKVIQVILACTLCDKDSLEALTQVLTSGFTC